MNSESTTQYDVLIVGGGMAGASFACALAPTGLRIGVVEAIPFKSQRQPSYDDRSIALAYGSRRIFEGMGIWHAIEQRGVTPIHTIHISDRGRFGATRLHAAEAGVEALGYVVENRVLGAALLAQLAALENVQLVCPANMLNLRLEEDRARVELDCDGEQRTVSGRLLVIADGGRSRARQMLGIGARRVDYGQTAVISNVTPELAHGNVAYERFTRSGPLALLPMTEGRCSLVWSVHPRQVDELLGLDDGLFLRRLHERFGDRLGAFQRVGRRHAYPLALMRVHEHVRPRVALIGNAAHALHPVAGQGFNLGLRDVAALAQVVNDALRDGQDFGALAVLSRYAAWRRRDNLAVTAFTDGLVRVFSNEFLPLVMARDAGLVAVDLLPPLKRALERRTMGLAGRLSRLARGLSLCG